MTLWNTVYLGPPSPSFAPKAKLCPIRCSPTLARSAGNTSASMATTSGRPTVQGSGSPCRSRSSKEHTRVKFRRLADVLEQAFFEVFGGFTWIERQFGGAFVVWLFEQVLNWTYIERGRLTDWCQRKGFHLFTRLRGSLLPAMLIQRENDRFVVLYKMCPDQRMRKSD